MSSDLVLDYGGVSLALLQSCMVHRPMTLDLFDTLDVVDEDVAAVVDVYMADPSRGMIAVGVGDRRDPAAVVAAHPFARTLMDQP